MTWIHLPSKHHRVRIVLVALLGLHGGLLAWVAAKDSPTVDEVNHLPAGLSHLYLGRFDLYRVNPPLVRIVAALPMTLMSPTTNWDRYDLSPIARPDLEVSQDFLKANGAQSLWFFTLARWACIPFSILGGYVCFRWARDLYGAVAGFLALILWCFCPYVLGHASLFTPDAPAAALGLAAGYVFWQWLRKPSWELVLFAGLILGLAELTKFTLLVFYPHWLMTWVIYRLPEWRMRSGWQWWQEASQLSSIVALSVFIINAGYNFEGSCQPLGDYRFQTRTMTGADSLANVSKGAGNRFAGTWLSDLPVPLPKNYLQGIDTQKLDFERGMRSFLHGEWKEKGGWWYYYLYALTIKLPLGTWCLMAMSIPYLFLSRYRSSWCDEMVLLLPPVAILVLVSSQTGFSIHSRYVLPALPFLYVWCSKVARSIEVGHKMLAVVGGLALCWSVGSSLWYFPHNLSYFNELVGGPTGGHAHLVDSNIAWGQDVYYLKRWYDEHPDVSPLHLACYSLMDPRLAGIEFEIPPFGPTCADTHSGDSSRQFGPQPGWYAIDMNHLHGAKLTTSDGQGGWQSVTKDGYDLTYFQRFQPVAMAGYSIYIYHITVDEANHVRKDLGLAELPTNCREGKEASYVRQ